MSACTVCLLAASEAAAGGGDGGDGGGGARSAPANSEVSEAPSNGVGTAHLPCQDLGQNADGLGSEALDDAWPGRTGPGGGEDGGVRSTSVIGVAIATCCHHCCAWEDYTAKGVFMDEFGAWPGRNSKPSERGRRSDWALREERRTAGRETARLQAAPLVFGERGIFGSFRLFFPSLFRFLSANISWNSPHRHHVTVQSVALLASRAGLGPEEFCRMRTWSGWACSPGQSAASGGKPLLDKSGQGEGDERPTAAEVRASPHEDRC